MTKKLNYREIVERYLLDKGATTEIILPVLEDIQEVYGYIPTEAMIYIADRLKVSPAWIYSTATFYHFFSLQPKGKVVIRVCRGTACHVMGSSVIMNELIDELGLSEEGTTPDGLFTLESVGCIGCCSTGPNMVVIHDGKEEVIGYLTPQKARDVVKQLKKEVSSDKVEV